MEPPDECTSEEDGMAEGRGVIDDDSDEVPVEDVPCEVPEVEVALSASANNPAKPRGPLDEMLEACPAPRLPIDTDASGQADKQGLTTGNGNIGETPPLTQESKRLGR